MMRHRGVMLPMLFLCALGPLGAMLLVAVRENSRGAPGIAWPVWEWGSQKIDAVELCAAVAYVGAAWFFERMMRAMPSLRFYNLLWMAFLAGGLGLFLMGRLLPGFVGIVGLALIGKAHEWRKRGDG